MFQVLECSQRKTDEEAALRGWQNYKWTRVGEHRRKSDAIAQAAAAEFRTEVVKNHTAVIVFRNERPARIDPRV